MGVCCGLVGDGGVFSTCHSSGGESTSCSTGEIWEQRCLEPPALSSILGKKPMSREVAACAVIWGTWGPTQPPGLTMVQRGAGAPELPPCPSLELGRSWESCTQRPSVEMRYNPGAALMDNWSPDGNWNVSADASPKKWWYRGPRSPPHNDTIWTLPSNLHTTPGKAGVLK